MSFNFRSITVVCSVVAISALMFTDLGQAQGRPGGRGGFQGFGNNSFALLRSEKVRGELDVLDEQWDEIQEIQDDAQQEMRDGMREMFQGMREMEADEREAKMAEIREEITERTRVYEDRLNEVLLPHQAKRLGQIALQSRSRGGTGVSRALTSDDMMEKLGINEEQKKKLEEAAEKATETMQKKIAKLQEEAKKEILGVLTAEQRRKFDEMYGDAFEFEANRGGRFGGFGGQRGQRGQRGGRDRGGDGGGAGRGPDF